MRSEYWIKNSHSAPLICIAMRTAGGERSRRGCCYYCCWWWFLGPIFSIGRLGSQLLILAHNGRFWILWCFGKQEWSILIDGECGLLHTHTHTHTVRRVGGRLPLPFFFFPSLPSSILRWAECVIELNSSEKLRGGSSCTAHNYTQVLFCVVTRLWSKRNDDRVTQATND